MKRSIVEIIELFAEKMRLRAEQPKSSHFKPCPSCGSESRIVTMLTDDQLATIEARLRAYVSWGDYSVGICDDIAALLAEIRELRAQAEKNRIDGHALWEATTYKIEKERDELRVEVDRLATAMQLVVEQAEDEGLWFSPETAAENYLQVALRRLHRAIEGQLIENLK